MTQLKDAIKRIAHYVEKNSLLEGEQPGKLHLHHPPERSTPPYKLTDRQIAQAIADYPFHLPRELLELYTFGNGCLPATSRIDCDCNSPESYFVLPEPGYTIDLLTLTEAIELSKSFTNPTYYKQVDQKLFPVIAGFERRMWATFSNEAECLRSPIVFFHEDPLHLHPAWPSLTDFLLAWIEVKERQVEATDEAEIKQIVRKYGGSWDGRGEGATLLYWTSFDCSDYE